MSDLTTPVASGTILGDLVNNKFQGRTQLFDTAGADALGLATTTPAANTVLGRLKAIVDAIGADVDSLPTGAATAAKQDTGNVALAAIVTALGGPLTTAPVATKLPANDKTTGRGGTTVVGAKNVAVANVVRSGMTFQNTSDTAMWLTEDGTDAAVGNGYYLQPIINNQAGGACNIGTQNRVSVYCSAAGKTYASTETNA